MRDLIVLFGLLAFSLFNLSLAQPFCGEFEGVLLFDGSDATPAQFTDLLNLVQGTARSFEWRGVGAARFGALQFSDHVVEEHDVLRYTEPEWANFKNIQQLSGVKNISQALQYASNFVMTPPLPLRSQYIFLFVTNTEDSAAQALATSQAIQSVGQRVVTIFLEGAAPSPSDDVSALATPGLAFTLSNDPSTYYPALYNISRAVCTDLNRLNSFEDECPNTFKIASGMCGCSTYDVNGCSLPTCSLPSTFENVTTGDEGWRIINTDGVLSSGTIVTYRAEPDISNSYLSAPQIANTDPISPRFFLAPGEYLGPQSQLFGGFVLFSLQLQLKSARFSSAARPRFVIEGDHTELILWKLPHEESLRNNIWVPISIPIINDGSLQVRDKTTLQARIALEQDILDVLQFVRSIRILIDYVDGYNGANFDNFKFCSYSRLDTFETSNDNYLVIDSQGKAEPSWQLNFISFRDRTPDETDFNFYFVPSWATSVACVGTNLTKLNGGFLGYDISLQSVNSSYKIADDVIIVGQNKELVFRLNHEEYPTVNVTRIRVPISETSGRWYVTDRTTDLVPNKPYPRIASPEDFNEVLGSVSFIYLRGEYLTQADTALLYTTFTIANEPDTCPGKPLCNGHGTCTSVGCSCYYGWAGPDCTQVASCAAGKFQLSNFSA